MSMLTVPSRHQRLPDCPTTTQAPSPIPHKPLTLRQLQKTARSRGRGGGIAYAIIYISFSETDLYAAANRYFFVYPATIAINNKDDWTTFADLNNRQTYFPDEGLNVVLNTDLSLGDGDHCPNAFKGTFDGQGHTIDINFTKYVNTYALYRTGYIILSFEGGTVKNLNITGSVYGDAYGFPFAMYGGSRVMPDSELKFENCHSNLTIVGNPDKAQAYGGFLETYASAMFPLTFTDCSFTGHFTNANNSQKSAGFVGEAITYSWYPDNPKWISKVTFNNCYSALYCDATTTTDSLSYFIGAPGEYTTLISNNSYAQKLYLNGSASSAKTARSLRAAADATVLAAEAGQTLVDAADMQSGHVAYLLNNGRQGTDAPWAQTVGTDDVPQHKLFSPESMEVYKAEASSLDISGDQWTTLFYPASVALPEGVTAYAVTGIDNGSVVLTPTASTANTPVVLQTAATTASIALPEAYYNKVEQSGTLKGVYETESSTADCYVLNDADGTATFEQAISMTLPAWTCYLSLPTATTATLPVKIVADPTAISGLAASTAAEGKLYNLSGQQIASPQRGTLYILNGRKYIAR